MYVSTPKTSLRYLTLDGGVWIKRVVFPKTSKKQMYVYNEFLICYSSSNFILINSVIYPSHRIHTYIWTISIQHELINKIYTYTINFACFRLYVSAFIFSGYWQVLRAKNKIFHKHR